MPVTAALLANQTLYAHIRHQGGQVAPDPLHGSFDKWSATTCARWSFVVFGGG